MVGTLGIQRVHDTKQAEVFLKNSDIVVKLYFHSKRSLPIVAAVEQAIGNSLTLDVHLSAQLFPNRS